MGGRGLAWSDALGPGSLCTDLGPWGRLLSTTRADLSLHPVRHRADATAQEGPNKRAKKGDAAGTSGPAAAGGKAGSEGATAAAAATSTLHVMDDELFMAAGGKDGGGGGGGGSGKEGAGSGSGHKPGGLTSFVAGRGKVRPWCPEQQ